MSDGSLLFFRAAVKPTPSIAATQQTVNKDGKEIEISIKGRHDPIIVPRAVVVVEAMTAITILDALLSNMTARLDRIIDFYRQYRLITIKIGSEATMQQLHCQFFLVYFS